MCPKYRCEKWEISYAKEVTFGEAPTALLTATNLFGVFQDATLPNPSFDHQGYWMQNPANRNFYSAYKGKATSTGSIGNIILLDGTPCGLPICDAVVHTGGPAHVHTMNETIKLPSIRIVCSNYEDEDTTPDKLVRWFAGGKVNSASYHCEEGGMLMMDMGFIFKMPYYTDAAVTATAPWHNAHAISQTITNPCREPYYFSQGTIKIKLPILGNVEATVTSIKSFRLDVTNELQPKYYLADNAEKVPYEIWEGRRQYKLNLQIDLVDMASTWTKDSPFLELLNQGMDTTFKGANIDLKFAKSATDYIQFTTPASGDPDADDQGALVISAPMNIGGTGIISVSMDMLCKDLKIVVADALASGAYPY